MIGDRVEVGNRQADQSVMVCCQALVMHAKVVTWRFCLFHYFLSLKFCQELPLSGELTGFTVAIFQLKMDCYVLSQTVFRDLPHFLTNQKDHVEKCKERSVKGRDGLQQRMGHNGKRLEDMERSR